jgi:NADPH:quinone reductase-like Zn-dependent oxidoreductase
LDTLLEQTKLDDLVLPGDLVAQKKLRTVIDRVYSLTETPQAMARAELHRARGKLVIQVA